MNKPIVLRAAAMLAALGAATAHAGDQHNAGFDLHAGTGYVYDSNVGVPELDTNSGNADQAARLELGADATLPLGKPFKLQFGYGYRQTAYREHDQYDLALHRYTGALSFHEGRSTYALAVRQFAASLDNERFLDLRQVSPSVSRLVGDRWYLRAAYTRTQKSFAGIDARDATGNAIGADAYLLLDGMQHYLAFGWEAERDDAADAAFDHRDARASVTWGRELEAPFKVALKARFRFERRNYDDVDADLNANRHDTRRQASFTASVPVTETFSVEGEARYADHASNLPAADLREAVYALSVAADFLGWTRSPAPRR